MTIPNTDTETGVKYGVVALDSLANWVFDEFFYHGRNLSSDGAFQDAIAYDGLDPDDDEQVQEFWDSYQADEEEYALEIDGMKLELSYLGGAPLVWVFKSPHTTECRECSPCCPLAGDLDSQDPGGFTTYTLPKEWFFDIQD